MTADWVSTLSAWARTLPADRDVVLLCAEASPDAMAEASSGQPVRTEQCLQTLSPADLAELVAATPRLLLRVDTCGSPDSLGVTIPAAAAFLAGILEQLGASQRLAVDTMGGPDDGGRVNGGKTTSPERTVRTLPVGRRMLFPWAGQIDGRRSGTESSTSDASQRRPPQTAEGHGEAREQLRLANALREIHRQVRSAAAREEQPHPTREPLPSPNRSAPRSRQIAAQGCTGCATCARSCPTGALSLVTAPEQSDQLQLTIDPAACIGCGHCIAICPAQALTDAGPMSWSELAISRPEALETISVRPCHRCRTPFNGDGDLCAVCQLRTQAPFGSFLPPTYLAPHVYAATSARARPARAPGTVQG